MGANVSGRKRTRGNVGAAIKDAAQNAHLQDIWDVKPETKGPQRAPIVLTVMKEVMATPRCDGLSSMSANSPLVTVTGAAALIPVNKRKTNSDGYVGATEQARVNIIYPMNDTIITGRRPTYSLKGPNNNGPRTNPAMLRELSKVSCDWLWTLKSSDMTALAPEGIEVPRLLLKQQPSPVRRIWAFRS